MRIILFITSILFSSVFGISQEFEVDYFHGDNKVNSISIIGDNVWVGGFLGLTRINRMNYGDKKFITDPFVNHQNYCFDIFAMKDNAGNLFVHDGSVLNKYQNNSIELIDSGDYITDFFIDENNTKWILRGNSVVKIENDGRKIVYNSDNSSLPNYNYSCLCARNNDVFLGSPDGCVKFNGKTVQIYNTGNTVIPYNNIKTINIDIYDNIWLICDTNGYGGYNNEYFYDNKLIKLTGENGIVYNPNISIGSVKKLYLYDDTVYLCTDIGLIKFNGSKWILYNKAQNQLLSNNVRAVAVDGNKIWVGSDQGISIVSPNKTVNIKLADATFSGEDQGPIVEDLSGNIWAGTGAGTSGSLCEYNGSMWKTVIQGSINDPLNIYSLAVDKNNIVWATDYNYVGRLFKIKNDSITIYDQNNSALPSYPEDIVVDRDNNKWIISDWEILEFNDLSWTVYGVDSFPFLKLPRSIATDKKGNIWIGVHQSGMVKYDGTNWIQFGDGFFGKAYSEVNKIIVDDSNNLWINYTHGTLEPQICKFDGKKLTWYNQNINLPEIDQFTGLLAVENNGDLWIEFKINSYDYGIAKYDWKKWEYYNTNNSRLISNQIGDFFIDDKHNKWISAGCYIARFNEDSLYNDIAYHYDSKSIYTVFPNPFEDYIYLKSKDTFSNELTLKIYDLNGSLLNTYSGNYSAEIKLNTEYYTRGIYMLQIIGNDFTEMHKILKVN